MLGRSICRSVCEAYHRRRVLVVGAGFAGAIDARELADRGFEVDVIDQRSHIAGNAFDEASETGVRVHRYGPHLFHTNLAEVVAWGGKSFRNFCTLQHKVQAQLTSGECVPPDQSPHDQHRVWD